MVKSFKDNLVIGVRLATKPGQIDSYETLQRNASRYLDYLRILSPRKIVGITIRNDNFETLLRKKCEKVEIIDDNDFGYAKPVEILYKLAGDNYLLIITIGVELLPWHLQHGYELLSSNNLLSIGWKITSQDNDGIYLGKLSYNTCQLYSPNFYEICKKIGGIPKYVENGVLGTLDANLRKSGLGNSIPIGGQEDLAVQLRLYKQYKNPNTKLFGLIRHYGLNTEIETGLDVTNNEKLFRKIVVAEIYRGIEEVTAIDFLDSWIIM